MCYTSFDDLLKQVIKGSVQYDCELKTERRFMKPKLSQIANALVCSAIAFTICGCAPSSEESRSAGSNQQVAPLSDEQNAGMQTDLLTAEQIASFSGAFFFLKARIGLGNWFKRLWGIWLRCIKEKLSIEALLRTISMTASVTFAKRRGWKRGGSSPFIKGRKKMFSCSIDL